MSQNIKKVKKQLDEDLMQLCYENEIDYKSLEKLIDAERVKKLRKGNHYIQQTIDKEIENAIKDEN